MSDQPANEMKTTQPRSRAKRIFRAAVWTFGIFFVTLILLLAGGAFYTTTADFQGRVNKQVVTVLEDATGGRVELQNISFDLWHLSIEANGLVIHGLEGPGEAPYLAADKVLIRVKIISFFAHTTGAGAASHIGLNLLRVEQPRVHLIIDKDGKTNQPVPKHKAPSNEPVIDTLLDLKATEADLVHGIAQVNDRAIPFNLAAQDLNATVKYIRSSDRYGAVIDLRDLRTQIQKQPEAKSSLHVEVELGRDLALLKSFDFHSGEKSELTASANIKHFAKPDWQANVAGSLELKQISILADLSGFDTGSIDLKVAGHSCDVAPVEAQKHPKLLDRLRSRREAAANVPKTLPPDPDCQKGYLLVGDLKLHQASYRDKHVRFHDINGGAQLHITPTQLLFTALSGYLPGGGSAIGELKIDNWLGEVPASVQSNSPTVKGATTTANKTATAITGKPAVSSKPAAPPQVESAHAYLTVTVNRIPLRTIMDTTAPIDYGDLGFDTAINGPVKVEWGGPVTNPVTVDAMLALQPTGVKRKGALSDIPVTGQINGHYDGNSDTVAIKALTFNTPESTLIAAGTLGVNTGDRLTALNVDLSLRDLGEYDQLLRTLDLTGNGRIGAAAIPITLHGTAKFHGTATGEIAKLDVKGHLEANNLEVLLGEITAPAVPPAKPGEPANLLTAAMNKTPAPAASTAATDVHIDSLVADADYTPMGLSVASSTITRGTAVLHLGGTFKARTFMNHKTPDYEWDGGTAVDIQVQLGNADVVDVLTIAGQQQKIPVTGTVALDAHAQGTFDKLNGSGKISLNNGVAYGEPYEAVNVAMSIEGQDFEASQISLKLHGMTIAGNGGYDLNSKHLKAHIQGSNLQLSKFTTVQKQNLNADALLSLVADADGTAQEPGLKANVKLANVIVDGKAIGEATVDAHSQESLVSYSLRSNLIGTNVTADGQTSLTGDYQTSAKLTIADLDVARPLALFQPGGMQVHTNISGVVNVSGPAKTPMAMNGSAQFTNFAVTSQGLTFKSADTLTIGLKNGIATLDQFHITGPDTDLRLSGTAQVLGAVNPKTKLADMGSGKLDVKLAGNVSMALAQTFDPDLITSGMVVFSVGAGGVISNPSLTGKVEFQNVSLAIDGVPNGLSAMNGTLAFNEDRLNVETLTARTGGGQLKLGGFLTFRNGIYADLTATGDVVRVRLYGLSATSNTSLRLQGNLHGATLSGNVLLTRFGIGPDVDFAAFAGSGGVQAPPDPSATSNKIQLAVHITSSPQLDFQNSYAKLAGTVDLNIRGTVANPTVLGRIQVTDGSATFAGTKYQLQRGDIFFSNPVRIDPTIDLDATARVENYDVVVGLHGTTTNLKPTYRSEPPLSEADIFSLLALGRTQEEAQLYSEQQLAAGTDPATSSLLGGALNATVGNRVSKLFGGGSVKIDPSYVGTLGNSSARITVQQQLSRQIIVTYATTVNNTAQQFLQVQYQLTPNSSIVVARDESGVFSMVFKIRKRYR